MALRRIDSIDEMHTYLAVAMQLEHATIPPYLTALYSMLPGRNSESSEVMRIVVVEEMLHMTLVANLMNSVGRHPDLTASGFVPRYPTHLPDGEADFEVSIRPFGREAVETLMRIERPGTLTDGLDLVSRPRSARALLPAYAHDDDQDMHFYSIGDFYGEIERGLRHLQTHEESGGATLFSGDPEAQVVIGEYFPDASQVGPVVDLDSALFAIDFITEQGEGRGERIYGDFDELSPFYRLEQILHGRHYQHGDAPGWPSGKTFQVDWTAVHPVAVDARIDDYAVGTPVRAGRRVRWHVRRLPAHPDRRVLGDPEAARPCLRHDVRPARPVPAHRRAAPPDPRRTARRTGVRLVVAPGRASGRSGWGRGAGQQPRGLPQRLDERARGRGPDA